jgi:hypothetical protein
LFTDEEVTKWIEFRGIKYKPSIVVNSGPDNEGATPLFVEVQHILIQKNGNCGHNVWFVGEKFRTVYFNSHFHAWHVERLFPVQIISLDARSLAYYTPLSIHSQIYKDDRLTLVSPRYHI